jgi:hypothetical protein
VKSILWIAPLVLCSIGTAQQTPAPAAPPAENIEDMVSIGVYYWKPNGGPGLKPGLTSGDPAAQMLGLPSNPSRADGLVVTIPAKGFSRVELSYFEALDHNFSTAPRNLLFFDTNIVAGDPILSSYKLTNFKVSWNYLTFPAPPLDARFRIKTFWEVQYTSIKPEIDDPLTDFPAVKRFNIIYPTAGLGLEYIPSKHFRVEARGSAFGLPKRAQIWDGEGSAVVRLGGLEIFAGEKLYHFRTSTQKDVFVEGTLAGPYGGVRWVFR